MKRNLSKRRERGLTILETSMALVVASIVAVGGLYMYGSSKSDSDYESSVQHIWDITQAVGVWKGNRSNYNGLDEEEVINTGLLDAKIFQGTQIQLPSVLTISMQSIQWGTGSSIGYRIGLHNLDYGLCIKFGLEYFGDRHLDTIIRPGAAEPNVLLPAPPDTQTLAATCDPDRTDNRVYYRFY